MRPHFAPSNVGKVTEECIKSELETRMNDQVVADCLRGVTTLTHSHGNTFGFLTFIFVSSSAIARFDVCP